MVPTTYNKNIVFMTGILTTMSIIKIVIIMITHSFMPLNIFIGHSTMV